MGYKPKRYSSHFVRSKDFINRTYNKAVTWLDKEVCEQNNSTCIKSPMLATNAPCTGGPAGHQYCLARVMLEMMGLHALLCQGVNSGSGQSG